MSHAQRNPKTKQNKKNNICSNRETVQLKMKKNAYLIHIEQKNQDIPCIVWSVCEKLTDP